MQNTVRNTAVVIRSVVDTYVAITVYGIAAGHESGALDVAFVPKRQTKRHTNATQTIQTLTRRNSKRALETSLLLRNQRQ